jgi:arylsulfatase A-like enzyme
VDVPASTEPVAKAAVAVVAEQERSDLADRVAVAILFGVVEDGLVAASATFRSHAGFPMAIGAALEAVAFLLFPLALVGAFAGAFASARGAVHLGRQLRSGLGGGDAQDEGLGLGLYALLLAAGAFLSWRAGVRVSDFQSARVATLVTLLAALICTLGGAVLVASVTPRIGAIGRRVGKRLPSLPQRVPVGPLFLAAVAVATAYLFLPPALAIAPAAACVGFAVGPAVAQQLRLPVFRTRRAVLQLVAGAGVLLGVALVTFDRIPEAVQLAPLARAPYTAVFVTGLRRLFDRDHDGYSAILNGGDCDDTNASKHPGSVDIPDNGIDENCSGQDAHKYVAPAQVPPRDPAAPPLRNSVILVHIDALRPDHVSFVGYKRHTTPKIDQFREGATWFKNAYTPAPSTRFAMAGMFTGLEVQRIPQRRGHVIDFTLLPEAVTLAERLAPLGYDRVGYTLSYVLQHITDVGQGFRVWETPWPINDWEASYHTSAEQTTAAAIKYLDGAPTDGSKPYLLFLHYACTHDPYIKHSAWDYGNADVDLYDSALSYCDDQLGKLFAAVDARPDKDKTAIFVFSDHGELFGEHSLAKHGNSIYQPDVKILLLARVPGGKVSTIEAPTSLTDLYPTVEELTGLPADGVTHAWDLMPYLRGAPMPSRPLFLYTDLWRAGVHYEARGVIDGDMKYIHDLGNGTKQVYDIAADPGELTSIAEARPSLREKYDEMVDGWEASLAK